MPLRRYLWSALLLPVLWWSKETQITLYLKFAEFAHGGHKPFFRTQIHPKQYGFVKNGSRK